MSDIVIPVEDYENGGDTMRVEREDLSSDDLEKADMFLDALDWHLRNETGPRYDAELHQWVGPGAHGGAANILHDFNDTTITIAGVEYKLLTDETILNQMQNDGDINPAEDHSL